MDKRYARLKKLPEVPALRLLAAASAKLSVPPPTPANADVSTVLNALAENYGWVDMIRLLSVALPPRECVWWSCLAGRDMTNGKETPCLITSEKWVFDPSDANRVAIEAALEAADPDDDTSLAATAALYAQGSLGTSDQMKELPAPDGALASCAFGINMLTVGEAEDPLAQLQLILERALDIARGGNGKIDPPPPAQPAGPPEPEDEEEAAAAS